MRGLMIPRRNRARISGLALLVVSGIPLLGVFGACSSPTDLDAEAQRTARSSPEIVFDMVVDGNRDIYRLTGSGARLERLTTHAADDLNPTAAASRVVFTSYRDGNAELYSVPLDGGTPVRLTETAGSELDPALSADGLRLAFARPAEGGVFKVWLTDAEGGGAVLASGAFASAAAVEGGPAWNPAGDRLAFMSTAAGTAGVYALELSSGTVTPLSVTTEAEFEPTWSPDGRSVAFASAATGDPELYLVDLITGRVTRLTERLGLDGQPAFLPDGRIVYTAWLERGGERVTELRWLDPADPQRIFPIPTGEGLPRNPSGVF